MSQPASKPTKSSKAPSTNCPVLATVRQAMGRSRRKEARPAEIVQAALTEFVDKGFAGASVQTIAKRAGVSKATVFVYFETKQELFKAVVRTHLSAPLDTWRNLTRNHTGSTRELVLMSLHQWWTDVGSTPAAGISRLLMQEAANLPELAEFYQAEVVEPGIAHMHAILQQGVDRGEFRITDLNLTCMNIFSPLLFLAMWHQAMGHKHPIYGPAIEPRAFIDNHASLLLDGLAKPA